MDRIVQCSKMSPMPVPLPSRRAPWLAVVAILTLPAALEAQDPRPSTAPDGAQFDVSVEARRDRFRYHFDNPSSVDTPFLVPHFFEQDYAADNVWVVATGRYAAGVRWETSIEAAPTRAVRADDYDTFLNPGGIVVVSGTTGDARMRSLAVSQRAEVVRAGPVLVSVGYRLRWDRFDFGLGHKSVTRNGVLMAASEDTSPEMTDSQVHEVLAGFRTGVPVAGAWRLNVLGELSPATLARLSVQLPDKYPGQDLIFLANVATASARVALVHVGAMAARDVDAHRTHMELSLERAVVPRRAERRGQRRAKVVGVRTGCARAS